VDKKIVLKVKLAREERKVSVDVENVICAGYTGRDRESVIKHVEELRRIGVPAPDKVPTFYNVPSYLLFTDEELKEFKVKGYETSGEVEYVLVFQKSGEPLLTIGSDHTDRWLERVSVERAKVSCPKIISSEAWMYEDVKNHLDEIKIRMMVKREPEEEWILYQEDKLGKIMRIEDLLRELNISKMENLVLFSGTIPILGGEPIYGVEYMAEMIDPIYDRRISMRYCISPIWP